MADLIERVRSMPPVAVRMRVRCYADVFDHLPPVSQRPGGLEVMNRFASPSSSVPVHEAPDMPYGLIAVEYSNGKRKLVQFGPWTWWGHTLAKIAAAMVEMDRRRVEQYRRTVDGLVRIAEHLHEKNGAWPAEILAPDGCGVPTIRVIDRPVAWSDLLFDDKAMMPVAFKIVDIAIGTIGGAPRGAWAFCAVRGGDFKLFYPAELNQSRDRENLGHDQTPKI